MNLSIEKDIVKKFVKKNKQERFLWELDSLRKRDEVIWTRLSHIGILKEECMYPIKLYYNDVMVQYLIKLGGTKNAYYMGTEFKGEMQLAAALKKATDEGDICIIYCGNGVGYYQAEQEQGPPGRYVLLEKNIQFIPL